MEVRKPLSHFLLSGISREETHALRQLLAAHSRLDSGQLEECVQNHGARSQIQAPPMELPGADSEHLKSLGRLLGKSCPTKGQALSSGTELCLLHALIGPQKWTRLPRLANWTQTRLTLLSRAPEPPPPGWPYLHCVPANCDISFLSSLLALRSSAAFIRSAAPSQGPFLLFPLPCCFAPSLSPASPLPSS